MSGPPLARAGVETSVADGRPVATISIDLDPVDVHLRGYGHGPLPPDPLVHERALPRLLDLFARFGVQATFFVLARDVPFESNGISMIRAAGHEVASHGIDHIENLASQSPDIVHAEAVISKRVLESVSGASVSGFRAPDWSVGPRLVAALVRSGYRYDASLMPTPALSAGRMLLAVKARRLGDLLAVRPPASLRREPFLWAGGNGAVLEFPLAVSPRLRFPVYHTLRPGMSQHAFESHLDGFVRRSESFSYALHGVDALGLHEDGVDARLRGHPGMTHSRDAKLRLLDRTVSAIVERFTVLPFDKRLDDPSDGDGAGEDRP